MPLIPMRETSKPLVSVRGLKVHFQTDEGLVKAVDGVDFDIPRGKTVCVVGESGSGKSITARAILNQVPRPGQIVAGSIQFSGARDVDIATLDKRGVDIRAIRGREIALISQEPMAALSPVHTIGNQIVEAIQLHLPLTKKEARERAAEMLGKVGIPKPKDRLDSYSFELSGGMRQRVCIAMALSCEPKLLIADEPTTALDVTTQANILDLIGEFQATLGMSVLFITHDLGVVAEVADEVVVMYLGRVAEIGTADAIFETPQHPYTQALLRSVPRLGRGARERLYAIPGMVPNPFDRPPGCGFNPRCDKVIAGVCDTVDPEAVSAQTGGYVRCHLHGQKADAV
ncbi:MAG: ABC transporter ATP-binding protein [Beijerinckiaceae bacterium]